MGPVLESADVWPSTYDDSRRRFRQAVNEYRARDRNVVSGVIDVPSRSDDDLTIDWCLLPAASMPRKLVIVSSGVHGIEGFIGAAMQMLMLQIVVPASLRTSTAFLFIHAINPWGFRHHRRVTENNVDLNRNLVSSAESFDRRNDGYDLLCDRLNPQRSVGLTWWRELLCLGPMLLPWLRWGPRLTKQAILEGQYHHPRGLYFGGRDFEPQKEPLERLLREIVAPYDAVLVMDFHSGYGERGRLHLIASPARDRCSEELRAKVFYDYPLDGVEDDEFYAVIGDMSSFINDLVPADKAVLPLCFEYGTITNVGRFGIIGAYRCLRTMILENQGHHHGYCRPADEHEVTARILQLYNPPDHDYRRGITEHSARWFPRFIERFSQG